MKFFALSSNFDVKKGVVCLLDKSIRIDGRFGWEVDPTIDQEGSFEYCADRVFVIEGNFSLDRQKPDIRVAVYPVQPNGRPDMRVSLMVAKTADDLPATIFRFGDIVVNRGAVATIDSVDPERGVLCTIADVTIDGVRQGGIGQRFFGSPLMSEKFVQPD